MNLNYNVISALSIYIVMCGQAISSLSDALFRVCGAALDSFKRTNRTRAAKRIACYKTLDNGGQPFRVCFDSKAFWVEEKDYYYDGDDGESSDLYPKLVVARTPYIRAFVGRSPRSKMTLFSGGHGPRFDGNSMLFELLPGRKQNRKYMYIGECVQTFVTQEPITTFVSPVGNNSVPYPYAADAAGTVYLFIEGVVLTPAGAQASGALAAIAAGEDPYGCYYNMTPDLAILRPDPDSDDEPPIRPIQSTVVVPRHGG